MQQPRIEWFRKGTRQAQAIGGLATALSSGDRWRNVQLESVKRPGPGELPEGHHPRHLLVVNLAGPVNVEVAHAGGSASATCLAGDVHLVPAGLPHAVRWDRATDCLLVGIAREAVNAFAGREVELPLRLAARDPLALEMALALHADLRSGSPCGPSFGESIGEALTAHLVRNHAVDPVAAPPGRGGLTATRLRAVLAFIDAHLEASISLRDLAERAGVSAYHFAHLFKASTGLPPHHFVVQRRVERAKALLREGALGVGEVALRSGFASASHFAVVFRRVAGMPPREFRRTAAERPRRASGDA